MMFLFKKPPPVTTPPKAKKYRKETHEAAQDASDELKRLNKILGNGITLRIYVASKGEHHHAR